MAKQQMNVTVDSDAREAADEVLGRLGITMSAYVNMAVVALAQRGGIPFDAVVDRGFWHMGAPVPEGSLGTPLAMACDMALQAMELSPAYLSGAPDVLCFENGGAPASSALVALEGNGTELAGARAVSLCSTFDEVYGCDGSGRLSAYRWNGMDVVTRLPAAAYRDKGGWRLAPAVAVEGSCGEPNLLACGARALEEWRGR